MHITESTQQLTDGQNTFAVTLTEVEQPVGVVVFAAGRGGSPLRHLGVLRALARQGYAVVAPHFDMLPAEAPTKQDLETRIRRLRLAMQQYALTGLPIFGVGHSLGCVALLVLSGAKAWTRARDEVAVHEPLNFDSLVLLAPAADFFMHPAASLNIGATIYLRTGEQDEVVPLNRVQALVLKLPDAAKVKFEIDEEAGHFSYMDQLPPQVKDCQPYRQTFLSVLAEDVCMFLASPVLDV